MASPDLPPAGHGRVERRRVDARHAGQRLDNYLRTQLKGVPHSHVYRLLRTGQVRVNGGRVKPAYRLQAGDEVRIPPVRRGPPAGPAPGPGSALAARLREAVVYEDDRLVLVDKPGGIAVHGGSGVRAGLVETLRGADPAYAGLELVHRLDKDTSGCLLLARDRDTLLRLHQALRSGQVRKRYLALLAGDWQGGPRTLRQPLERRAHASHRRQVVAASDGKSAISRFAPQERFGVATLVRVEIMTGRTHQIRVHAAELGHPVAGDPRYGDPELNRRLRACGLRRMFLHASAVGFRLEREYRFGVPLPEELEAVLARLRA